MQLWWLDFHESIRFSKTHSKYQEQPYPLEKTTIVFLDPPTKLHVTFVGYSWNIQGIFIYSIFPEHYFGNIPRNFMGNFFGIFRECIMGMFHEYSTNIYLPGGNSAKFLKTVVCQKICRWWILNIIMFLNILSPNSKSYKAICMSDAADIGFIGLAIIATRLFTMFNRFCFQSVCTFNNNIRSSQQRCSVKKGVLRNFPKSTGKHLCQSHLFNKASNLQPY